MRGETDWKREAAGTLPSGSASPRPGPAAVPDDKLECDRMTHTVICISGDISRRAGTLGLPRVSPRHPTSTPIDGLQSNQKNQGRDHHRHLAAARELDRTSPKKCRHHDSRRPFSTSVEEDIMGDDIPPATTARARTLGIPESPLSQRVTVRDGGVTVLTSTAAAVAAL